MAEYEIEKGDSLSILAKKLNTTIDELMKLNSEQIKNPDLIFIGNKLKLPEETVILDKELVSIDSPPDRTKGVNTTCHENKFIDILYIPAHPETGKQKWYAITECARNKILNEKSKLEGVFTSDYKQTLNNLKALGLLTDFYTFPYDQFLTEKEMIDYRKFLWIIIILKNKVYKEDDLISTTDNLYTIYNDIGEINSYLSNMIKDSLNSSIQIKNSFDDFLANENNFKNNPRTPEIKEYERLIQSGINNAVWYLKKAVNEKIENLEKKSIDEASQIKTDDGTVFTFSDDLGNFTSEKEENIDNLSEWLLKDIENEENSFAFMSPSESKEEYELWLEKWEKQNQQTYLFYNTVYKLNSLGITFKEQCLSIDEMVGSSAQSQTIKKLTQSAKDWHWRKAEDTGRSGEPVKPDIIPMSSSDTFISGITTNKSLEDIKNIIGQWAYLPTLALVKTIDRNITHYQAQYFSAFQTDLPLKHFFGDLYELRKWGLIRLRQLKKIAQERVLAYNRGDKSKIKLLHDSNPEKLTLIWQNNYTPKIKVRKGFKLKSPAFKVIESCLLSEGNVFYLRHPSWFMPNGDDSIAHGHMLDITENVYLGNSNATIDIMESIKNIKDIKNLNIDLYPIVANSGKTESIFWQAKYHYKEGLAPDNSGGDYNHSFEAQFLRFSMQGSASVDHPLNKLQNLTKPISIKTGINIAMDFTLLEARAKISVWLPQNENDEATGLIKKTGGHLLEVGYFDNDGKLKQYNAGEISARIDGSLGGSSAATLKLTGNIAFGESDVSTGDIGIKGSSVSGFDDNIQHYEVIPDSNANPNFARELGGEVNVFAGIKATGSIGAEVFWKPPGKGTHLMSLGSLMSAAEAILGFSYKASARLIIQGGVLVLVLSSSKAFGVGTTGTVGIKIDPIATSRFLRCILAITKQTGFSHLDIFGELEEDGKNPNFEYLNAALTAMMLAGISIADALLMPLSSLINMQKREHVKKYAPFLAEFINDEETSATYREWVINLPPETLKNLFNALTIENYNGKMEQQAQAITAMVQWLWTDSNHSNEQKQKQWEKTLIRMAGPMETQQEESTRVESLVKSWLQLARFVKSYGSIDDKNSFNHYSRLLCANYTLTKEKIDGSHNPTRIGLIGGISDRINYRAYLKNDMLTENFSTQEKIIQWSTHHVD